MAKKALQDELFGLERKFWQAMQDKDVETAAREIQAAIQAAGGDLPPNMPSRPSYRKVDPNGAPILIIALRSKSLELPEIYEAANTVLVR